MGPFREGIGFDPSPDDRIGFDPQRNWLRSGAHRRKWLCSPRELASIPTPRAGSFRIPDGFDPRNGSVPRSGPRPTGRPGAGWLSGVRVLGRAMRQPSSAKGRPDRINASRQATVPRYYRGMRGRLITLPGTIDGSRPLFPPRPPSSGRGRAGAWGRGGVRRPARRETGGPWPSSGPARCGGRRGYGR
jgi:hypothetical protein